MSGFQRRKRPLDDWLAARREAQQLTVRCTLDGCTWSAAGSFADTRQAAADHRAQSHPGHRPRSRKQLLTEHERQHGRQRRVGQFGDKQPAKLEQAVALYAQGWTISRIYEQHGADWGYGSVETFSRRLRPLLRERGIAIRRVRPQPPIKESRLPAEAVTLARELVAQGWPLYRIACRYAADWGYSGYSGAYKQLSRRLREAA